MFDEVASYRPSQLAYEQMPGYQSRGSLDSIVAPRSGWRETLSLSIYRQNPDTGELEALTGVRRGSDTHENVVSTATRALPKGLGRLIVEDKRLFLRKEYEPRIGTYGPNPRERGMVAEFYPNPQPMPDSSSILPYAAQELLAHKCNVSHLMQQKPYDQALGTVSLSRIIIATPYVGEDTYRGADDLPGMPTLEELDPDVDFRLYEALVLFGATLMVHADYAASFPTESSRYQYIGWTSAKWFANDVWNASVEDLVPSAPEQEAVLMCRYGACLSTTEAVTQGHDLEGHLGLNDSWREAFRTQR